MNTAAIRLTQDVGIGNFIKKLHKFGITSPLSRDLSLVLGSSGVSAIELTAAYAALMNEGIKVEPYGIKRILTDDGVILYDRSAERHVKQRVAREKYVERLNLMLAHAVQYGTGRAAQIEAMNTYGKTGTSQDSRDAWFVGFNTEIASAVWLGNDDNTPMDHITGGALPAKIWQEIMTSTLSDKTPPRPSVSSEPSGFSALIHSILGSPSAHTDTAPKQAPSPQYNE